MTDSYTWALAIDNRGGTAISLFATEALAIQSLIKYCEQSIEGFTLIDVNEADIPDSISEQMSDCDEWYVLQACHIEGAEA